MITYGPVDQDGQGMYILEDPNEKAAAVQNKIFQVFFGFLWQSAVQNWLIDQNVYKEDG